jgi:hypothetical protein
MMCVGFSPPLLGLETFKNTTSLFIISFLVSYFVEILWVKEKAGVVAT